MASVDLDNLSDAEIRSKLVELGQDVGPVTATTRKLYLKKLKSLLDKGEPTVDLNSSAKFDPRNISRSSADEESDEGTSRSSRRSMPPPRSNKSPKRKSPTRATVNNEPLANSTFFDHKVTKESSVSYNSPPVTASYETRRSLRSLNNTNTSPGIYGDDEYERDVSHSRSTRPLLSQASSETYKVTHSPPKFTSPDLASGLSDAFKSRLQASGSSSFSSSYTSPRASLSNQPYASDFVRKLSANRSVSGMTSSSSINSKLLDVKESDDEDSGSAQVYTRFTQGGRTPLGVQGRGKGTTLYTDSWLPFDSPVSAVLLLLFSLFFLIIGITYVNMHSSDTSVSSPSDIYYPICSQASDSHISRVNCIREQDKDLTGKIFKIIYTELHDRLKNSPCSKIGSGPFGMSDIDLQAAVLEHDPTMGTWITQQQLPNVKILITANPKLKLVDISGGIAILNPPLPLFCYITNNLMVAANWFAKSLVVSGLFAVVYFGIRYWIGKEASHKEEVYKLVNNVIEIISTKGPDTYIPIIHVRDQLIPPQDRSRMEKLWSDAVVVLNSDSRVRCEQQVVEGEDCLVWRWVASSYNSNKRKTWQGQAFDTMEGSVNSLPNSPTSCLKIRHMFDAALEEGDDWVGTVVDAILVKTKQARILHIAVERQSREGCVYMKCASPADAGVAYRALHGSWFDSKLVTVKYIREARYLERFPESAKCTQPLYPSNQSHNYIY